MIASFLKVSVVLLALTHVALCACPSSGAISPCVCREETPGRILDCASVTSGTQLATLMQNDMGDPHWDFLEVIKDGGASLDSLPANVFADKTITHLWIGDSAIATVDPAAFTGQEERMLEALLGSTPSLTSFPFSALEPLTVFFQLQITGSGITSITSFGAPPALSQVKITNAAVSSIESGAFSAVPALEIVDLAGNTALTEVTAGAFQTSTTKSWSLYLDGCNIASVADTAFSGTLPSTVALGSNALTTFPESAFGAVMDAMVTNPTGGSVGGVSLAGNPILCDCGLAWFATDAQKLPLVKYVVCANDENKGTALEDLPADFFASC